MRLNARYDALFEEPFPVLDGLAPGAVRRRTVGPLAAARPFLSAAAAAGGAQVHGRLRAPVRAAARPDRPRTRPTSFAPSRSATVVVSEASKELTSWPPAPDPLVRWCGGARRGGGAAARWAAGREPSLRTEGPRTEARGRTPTKCNPRATSRPAAYLPSRMNLTAGSRRICPTPPGFAGLAVVHQHADCSVRETPIGCRTGTPAPTGTAVVATSRRRLLADHLPLRPALSRSVTSSKGSAARRSARRRATKDPKKRRSRSR